MKLLRRLFRPCYGTAFEVRPTHWWSLHDRRCARFVAAVADEHADDIQSSAVQQLTDRYLFGR